MVSIKTPSIFQVSPSVFYNAVYAAHLQTYTNIDSIPPCLECQTLIAQKPGFFESTSDFTGLTRFRRKNAVILQHDHFHIWKVRLGLPCVYCNDTRIVANAYNGAWARSEMQGVVWLLEEVFE